MHILCRVPEQATQFNVDATRETGCGGLAVRASALQSGGCGFKLRPGHNKYLKNGTFCLLALCSAQLEWGKVS